MARRLGVRVEGGARSSAVEPAREAEAPAQPAAGEAVAASVRRAPAEGKRDPAAAVTFVRGYDAALGLAGERLKSKEQLLASDPFVFFRATPALFHKDLAGAFAE